MSDDQGRCLAAREIVAYLDGVVTGLRKAEIDRHLDECRLCGAAVEGVAGLEWREGFLRSTDSLLARVRARTATAATAAAARRRPVPRFRPAPRYLTLAATVVLGVGAAIVLTRPHPGEALFQKSFEPYPSARPVDAPAEWYLALAHLRADDPAEARPHLERIAGAGGFYQDKARALLSELDFLGIRP